jgi:hypothetical protein
MVRLYRQLRGKASDSEIIFLNGKVGTIDSNKVI